MRYRPNVGGARTYLLTDPDLKRELRRRANLGLAFARTQVPRNTGRLRDSGHVEETATGGMKRDRMAAEVVFDAPHAAAVEFGNRRTRARPYLRPTVRIIERG